MTEDTSKQAGSGGVGGTELSLPRPPRSDHRRRSKLRRTVVSIALSMPVMVLVLWIAIHRVGWLGPWLADTLRSIVGVQAVTELEKVAYGVQDWWDLRFRGDEAPKQYWQAPKPASDKPTAQPSASTSASHPASPESDIRFRPPDVGPVYEGKATDADGVWVPILDPRQPNDRPLAFKTMLHADPQRSWSEVFIVALDLSRIRLHYMLGSTDPKPTTQDGRRVSRPAKIPVEQWDHLFLAFNGGFKTEHRRYGVKVGDTLLVPGRVGSCTVAYYSDDRLRVRTWDALEPAGSRALWFRQTPPCLCEQGTLHSELHDEMSRKWGSLSGETVIRRSGVGLDRQQKMLFVAISNATTALVLARALQHAGVHDAAQLDVNWSYTKIVTFRMGKGGQLLAEGLVEGFVFDEDEYLRQPSVRDFFYVVRHSPPAR